MIHHTPEGHIARIGLNISVGTWRKPWVAFRWVWYDTVSRNLTSRRIRIRLYQWPAVLMSKDKYNVVHGFLWERNAVVVNRDVMRDMCKDLDVEYTESTYTDGWK